VKVGVKIGAQIAAITPRIGAMHYPNSSRLNVQQATAGKAGGHFNSVGGSRVQLQAIGAGV